MRAARPLPGEELRGRGGGSISAKWWRVGSQPAVAKLAAPATRATGEFGTRRQDRAGRGAVPLLLRNSVAANPLAAGDLATWAYHEVMAGDLVTC